MSVSQSYWSETQLRDLRRLGDVFIASRHLDQVSTARSLMFVGLTIVSFASSPVLYRILPMWVGGPLAVLVLLRALNCLSQVTHMSVHGTLLRNRSVGDVLGDLCAYALGYTLYIRKQTHLEHHRALNTSADPDGSWGAPDQTPAQLLRGIVGDLLGLSILQKAVQYYSVERRRFDRTFEALGIIKFLVGLLAVQAVVVLCYGTVGYLLVFVVPMATLYPAMIRLRSFVEHNLEEGYAGWMSRTVSPSWIERFVMAPGHQFLHFEHHAYPGLPLYHLPQLHAYLVQCGAVVEEPIGYIGYLRQRLATG